MQQNNARAQKIEKYFNELRYVNMNKTKKVEDWINTPFPQVPATVDEYRKSIGRPIYKSLPQTAVNNQTLHQQLKQSHLRNDFQAVWLALGVIAVLLIAVSFFLSIVSVLYLLLDQF